MDANTSHLLEEERRQKKAEQRQDGVYDLARDLVKHGQECYPWKYDNFTEAIENAPEHMRMTFFANVSAACEAGCANHVGNQATLFILRDMVEDYWFEAARVKAEEKLNY